LQFLVLGFYELVKDVQATGEGTALKKRTSCTSKYEISSPFIFLPVLDPDSGDKKINADCGSMQIMIHDTGDSVLWIRLRI
jgi:hypothetical protein